MDSAFSKEQIFKLLVTMWQFDVSASGFAWTTAAAAAI